MRKSILTAVVCLGSAAAFGQMADTAVKVNLPVAATIGGVTLPAGQYTIREMSNGASPVVQISAYKGQSVSVLAQPVIASKNASKTEVVLRPNSEGGYKLQSLWIEGEDTGLDFE